MLKMRYEAETGNDDMNALTIANAIIDTCHCGNYDLSDALDDIEEIADHLLAYVKRGRKKEESR
jgi:hypothetical protein